MNQKEIVELRCKIDVAEFKWEIACRAFLYAYECNQKGQKYTVEDVAKFIAKAKSKGINELEIELLPIMLEALKFMLSVPDPKIE